MTDRPEDLLQSGPMHWFSEWPIGSVPTSGAIVYTIWNRAYDFIYVGMSGRTQAAEAARVSGPYGRLNSHASGRRSGDQFCIYGSDRFVLPRLQNRIAEIADGTLSLDAETRAYIRENLGFRWVTATSGKDALKLEREIQAGSLCVGKPALNPSR